MKLPLIQLVSRLPRVGLSDALFPLGPTTLNEATSFFVSMVERGAETKLTWRNANSQNRVTRPHNPENNAPEGLK